MTAALYPIFGALAVTVASLSCGLLLFQRLGVYLRRIEHHVLAFLVGSACLSLVVLFVSAVHLARKGVFLALVASLGAVAYRNRRRIAPKVTAAWAPRSIVLLGCAIAIPYVILYFVNAWAPEVSPDGSGYHLGNVLRYWSSHGLVPIRDMYGGLPEGLEMLFLFAFSIGRHSAAALVHFSFLLALPVLMVSYSSRFGFLKAGLLAATLVFLSPVVGKDGSVAYNDVALAASAFAVFYLLEIWLEEANDRLLVLAGVLSGFSFAIKYTGIVVAVYALGLIAWKAATVRRLEWRPLLLFIGGCLPLVVPWLVKDAVYLHNPVSPFFNALFPNAYVSPKFEKDYAASMANFAQTSNLRELAIKYAVTGVDVEGILGPLFLLAPLGLMVCRSRQGRRLLLAAVVFGAPVIANGGTRFLIPAAPCIALAIGQAVADTRIAVPALMLLHGVASWPNVTSLYCDRYAWRTTDFPLNAAVHRNNEAAYLLANLGPGWLLGNTIEREAPADERIFCLNCPPQAYFLRDYVVGYESLEGNAYHDMLWTAMEADRQPRKQILLSFSPLTTKEIKVALFPGGPRQVWRITELRISREGHEMARSPLWRIGASPDPWEAPFAFDNNPSTKWSAEEYGAGGSMEIRFGNPVTLDSILLECPANSPERVELEAESPGGGTMPVRALSRISAVDPPAGMRRAAVEAFEAGGFHYLVMSGSDYYADDFKKYDRFWGIRAVAQAGDWTLYRLE